MLLVTIAQAPYAFRVPSTRIPLITALLVAGALAAFALSLLSGSVAVTLPQAWSSLTGHGDELSRALLLELRLPRALSGFAVGGTLAMAGVLMQVLLRNPLADPFVMGVSGGAAVGALAAMLAGLSGMLINTAAGLGAFGTTLLVFALAHGEGSWTVTRLLLTGIVVASGCSALVSLLLALGDETRLRGMLFWLMGDLSYAANPVPLLLLFAIALIAALPFARHLNVLARGELQARLLGLPVHTLRMGIFAATSLLTAATVTTAGTVGFVGLVTPHIVRLMIGSDHRWLLPAAAVLGGTLVMLADVCARVLFAPRQLPVGALTALAGVPLFLLLIRKQRIV